MYTLFLLIIILVAGSLFVYFGPRAIVQVNGGLYSIFKLKRNESLPGIEEYELDYEKIEVRTKDNLLLKGYFIHSMSFESRATIIFIHGIRGIKEHYLPIAESLARKGYSSVLFDLRGHGESDGKYCTYGYFEKYDVISVLDHIKLKFEVIGSIGVWGQSLGGAISYQAMGISNKIQFGIVESVFTDFQVTVHNYFKYYTGTDFIRIVNFLIKRAGNIAGIKPDDIKPYAYAQKIKQPMLVAHGAKDRKVNIDEGIKNFNNISCPQKEFVEYSEADHLNLWQVGGDEYFKKVFNFIENNSK